MCEKGFLLLFLSQYRERDKEDYFTEDSDGQEICFSGVQTNDTPVKYLIYQAAKNNVMIQKIACIVTAQIKENGDFDKFQEMIN